MSPIRLAATAAVMSFLALPLSATAAGGKGMTWGKVGHDRSLGADHVACEGCNPYVGDTACRRTLPVLCLKVDGSPRPNYPLLPVDGIRTDELYRGWAAGHIAISPPVRGEALTSLAEANAVCGRQFGAGWRMAEFHDGRWVEGMSDTAFYGNATNSASPWPEATREGGWGFYAFGHVPKDKRFWVYINDQPGNCWNP